MTDGDALHRAILADPADDTARLVYADWLDENARDIDVAIVGGMVPHVERVERRSDGRRERAEFIRVQCELAAIGPMDAVGGKGVSLRRRERELWLLGSPVVPYGMPTSDWSYHLSHEAPPFSHSPMAVVRRGFVDEVRCPAAAFLGGKFARDLFRTHPITRGVLTDREPDRVVIRGRERWGFWTNDRTTVLPDWTFTHGEYLDTRDAAIDWLSARLVTFGRRQYGLPPLPSKEATHV
jgi:uncharacterized protein (TIGR02996 family)